MSFVIRSIISIWKIIDWLDFKWAASAAIPNWFGWLSSSHFYFFSWVNTGNQLAAWWHMIPFSTMQWHGAWYASELRWLDGAVNSSNARFRFAHAAAANPRERLYPGLFIYTIYTCWIGLLHQSRRVEWRWRQRRRTPSFDWWTTSGYKDISINLKIHTPISALPAISGCDGKLTNDWNHWVAIHMSIHPQTINLLSSWISVVYAVFLIYFVWIPNSGQ